MRMRFMGKLSVVGACLLALLLTGCGSDTPPGVKAVGGQPYSAERDGKVLTIYSTLPKDQYYLLDTLRPLPLYAFCWYVNKDRTRSWGKVSSESRWRNNRVVFVFKQSLEGRNLCKYQVSKVPGANRMATMFFYFN